MIFLQRCCWKRNLQLTFWTDAENVTNLWGTYGNVYTSSWARWKAHDRLAVSDNWNFSCCSCRRFPLTAESQFCSTVIWLVLLVRALWQYAFQYNLDVVVGVGAVVQLLTLFTFVGLLYCVGGLTRTCCLVYWLLYRYCQYSASTFKS